MDDSFGHWLAGFLDGEACFFINGDPRNGSFWCGVKVVLRADDAAVLETIHTTVGLGVLGRNDWHHRQRATNSPTARWEVGSRAETQALVKILDRYPLRSKKARDYAIWREAVAEVAAAREPSGSRAGQKGGRARKDWSRVAALKQQLTEARRYR